MGTKPTTDDVIDLLQRRSEILAYVRAQPREKRAFVDDLGVARSTLDRAIRELESAELVAYRDGEYELTAVGERLLVEYDAFVQRTELTLDLEPFLRWVPQAEFDLDLRHLADAELWTPQPNDPWSMVNRHVRAIETADEARAVLPLVGLHAFEMVHQRVIEDGAQFHCVVEPGVAETLANDENYAQFTQDLQAVDAYSCTVYDGSIPFFVGVFDDETVQIGVDEEKEPRALLETDRPEVRAWADDLIETYQREASGTAGSASSAATSD